jgi:alpha-tubulin suppressor-like RCC1 family protein
MNKRWLLALCLASVWIAVSIAAGAASATPNGVMAWGSNEYGEVGDGTLAQKDLPVTLPTPSGVVQVAAGNEFSLALLENGHIYAWGENEYGQLGINYELGPQSCAGTACSKTPFEVPGLSEVTAISASTSFASSALALRANGTVMAWGYTFNEEEPEEVAGLSEVSAISEGDSFSLALLKNGTVKAWGRNECGQLGDGTTVAKSTPTEVSGLTGVVAIAAGIGHSLALLENGTVKAWGCNQWGQLGDGSLTASDVPQEVSSLTGVTAVSAGGSFSLARLESGKAVSWGANNAGQLGVGEEEGPEACSPSYCSKVPVVIGGLSGVTALSGGEEHALALLENGTVEAWGEGYEGRLGNGEEEEIYAPVAVGEITRDVAGISAGENHSLAFGPPGPLVSAVTPATGPPSGGTKVEITGHNFSGVTAVKFGSTNASSYEVVSPTLIKATSPAGSKTVHVQVTTSTGTIPTSPAGTASSFRYVAAGAPEFGRCEKVAPKTGKYNSSCTAEKASGNFEWKPGVVKAHFTLSAGEATLETTTKQQIVCSGETGAGEYSGTKALANVTIELTGCARGALKCTSAGAAEGEVQTSTLAGALGWKNASTSAPALDLAASSGEVVAEFSCAGTPVTIVGSVIVGVEKNTMQTTSTLKYEATGGKQKPEHFDEEPNDVLETSFGGAFEQTGLVVTTTQTNEEEVEINAAI